MKNAMPTMKDVAQEAGVALGTVSKVFNGIPVGESYRIKVEEAARKLGYQVNQYARGLKTNKTNMVAVILPGVDHPFFAALAQHICTALARRDYRMLLYVTASNPEIEQNCVNMVRQNKADGIIGLTYNPLAVDEELPFVGIDRSFRADIPCVAADNYGGGRLAAEKLFSLIDGVSLETASSPSAGPGRSPVRFCAGTTAKTARRCSGSFCLRIWRKGSWILTASSAPQTCWPGEYRIYWRSWDFGCRRMCRSSALTASGGLEARSCTARPLYSPPRRWRKPAWICCWQRTAPIFRLWCVCLSATPPAGRRGNRERLWQANI